MMHHAPDAAGTVAMVPSQMETGVKAETAGKPSKGRTIQAELAETVAMAKVKETGATEAVAERGMEMVLVEPEGTGVTVGAMMDPGAVAAMEAAPTPA
jgi:hypothetical protein